MFAITFGVCSAMFSCARTFSELRRVQPKEDFPKMRQRLLGLIALAALSMILPGCDNNGNNNANTTANTNANHNANLATPTPTPAIANTNSNRAPTREEYERNKEQYQREAKGSGRTIGSGVNDGWLWVKTSFDFAAADALGVSTINVDVDNSVVTLSGTVASAAQRTRAEQVAKAVDGVKSVRNQLKVSALSNTNTNANANHNANANRAAGTNRNANRNANR